LVWLSKSELSNLSMCFGNLVQEVGLVVGQSSMIPWGGNASLSCWLYRWGFSFKTSFYPSLYESDQHHTWWLQRWI